MILPMLFRTVILPSLSFSLPSKNLRKRRPRGAAFHGFGVAHYTSDLEEDKREQQH
jgi:hypothetical protein